MAEKLLQSDKLKDRDHLDHRFGEMQREYQTFEPHYKDLSEFVDPRRGRFFVEDRNRGGKRHKNIINNTATFALAKATAGLLAGAVSPSRPWFAYDMMDKDILRDPEIKVWIELLRKIVLLIMNKSNFYNMAPTMLRELILFGTGCMTHVDDFDDVARFYTHTVGSYYISQNSRKIVDGLARKFQMTAYQMVQQFGIGNVSIAVRNNFNNHNKGSWHTVRHLIELNPFRDEERGQMSSEFMRYRSVYWEQGQKHTFLQKKGFKGFPGYVPRWEVTGEDIYGTSCPGMTILGDVRQLQGQERELAKGIAKNVTPVLQGPPSLKNQPIRNLPGGVIINTSTNNKLETVYDVDPRVSEMMVSIQSTEGRIKDGMYLDLFMAITEMDGIQPKNQLQLSQVNAERMLQLGPVLEQVHGEWLSRVVDRVTNQVLDAGIMPDAPEKLQGRPLDIEFISALAMAQKSVATGAIERTIGFAAEMGAGGLDVSNKIDADFALDEYSSLVGAPPRMIVPTTEAVRLRQETLQQQQQQQQLEMAGQAANIAKMASDAKLGDDNVLSSAIGRESQG